MEKKNELVKLTALWSKQGQRGEFFTGRLGDAEVIAFRNTHKKNEREPDLKIYVKNKEFKKIENTEQNPFSADDDMIF